MFEIKRREVKLAIMLLIAGGIIYFFYMIKRVLPPFILGIILAYLFNPWITFLRKKRVSRSVAIYIIVVIFLIIFIFTAFFILPVFMEELQNFTVMIPKYINLLEDYSSYINREYRKIEYPLIIKEAINNTLQKIEEQATDFMENVTNILFNSISIIFSLLIAPIITYYLLKDMEKLKKGFIRLVPRKRRRLCLRLSAEINKIFVGYLRGQIWVSIIVGVLSSTGLYFLQIKFYTILGLFAGLTNMIPYIGPIIGGIPAVFIALLNSPLRALGVILLYLLIQQIESSIIGPKIMSEKVGLPPLAIIFSLLAGAEIFGVWGLFLAIPVAGSIKVILRLSLEQVRKEQSGN